MATPPTDGTMTRLFVCSEHNAVPLPDKITWQESGCIQPLAVAVQIARRAGVLAHQSVAVVGCGPLGLLTLAVARAHGARALVAIDVNPARVEFAQRYIPQAKCYAMPQFAPTPSPTQASAEQLQAHCIDFANKVIKDVGAAHAHGLDVVVEASGAESAILTGMHLLRHGGTYVQAGLGRPFTMFPTFALADKELTIRGSLRYTAGCFEDAIHLIEVGAVDVKSLITRTVPLSHVEQAFEAFARGDEIKVVIMNQE